MPELTEQERVKIVEGLFKNAPNGGFVSSQEYNIFEVGEAWLLLKKH